MITVPVLDNFDYTRVIGSMTIEEEYLPVNLNYYDFSIGYVKGINIDKLLCVSLVSVPVAHDTPNVLDGVRLPDGSPK